MAHTVSRAFWAALVTPMPASSDVTSPTISAATEPLSECSWIWLPMIGNWCSTEFSTDCCAAGLLCSTNPRIVVNTSSSGNSEKNA